MNNDIRAALLGDHEAVLSAKEMEMLNERSV